MHTTQHTEHPHTTVTFGTSCLLSLRDLHCGFLLPKGCPVFENLIRHAHPSQLRRLRSWTSPSLESQGREILQRAADAHRSVCTRSLEQFCLVQGAFPFCLDVPHGSWYPVVGQPLIRTFAGTAVEERRSEGSLLRDEDAATVRRGVAEHQVLLDEARAALHRATRLVRTVAASAAGAGRLVAAADGALAVRDSGDAPRDVARLRYREVVEHEVCKRRSRRRAGDR